MEKQIGTILSLLGIIASIMLGFYLFEAALLNIIIFWSVVVSMSFMALYIFIANQSSHDLVRIEGKHAYILVMIVGLTTAMVSLLTAFTVKIVI